MKRFVVLALSLAVILLAVTGCRTISRVKEHETLYFVGGFSNWLFEPLRRDANNPYLFKMGRVMTWQGDGRFRFGTRTNSWENQYSPTVANATFSHSLVLRDCADYNSWLLQEAESNRAYKMSLDTGSWPMVFTMFPFEAYPAVYLAGDAAGGMERNADFAMEMVDNNPFMFSWYGRLSPGQMSFFCEGYSGGDGPWFEPWKDGLEPNGLEQQVYLSAEPGGRGWYIDREGYYLVVIDQLQEFALVIRDN